MFLKESSKNALTFPCCQANIAVVKCWNKIQLPSKNRCWLKSLNSTPTEDGYRSEQSFRNLILNFCEFRFARMRVAVCRVDLRYLLLVGVRFWKGIQEAKNNTRNSVCEYRVSSSTLARRANRCLGEEPGNISRSAPALLYTREPICV